MFPQILTKQQIELLPAIACFKRNFGLVGGTAIALQLGHRRSIDFDLFTFKEFDSLNVRKVIAPYGKIDSVLFEREGEFTFVTGDVKLTFLEYPYPFGFSVAYENYLVMPDLLTLAALKAFALGRRAKWKDYVDLYFLLNKFGMFPVVEKAEKIFAQNFNQKLFREQLAYFDDVDYGESVVFMPGFEVSDSLVIDALRKHSISA